MGTRSRIVALGVAVALGAAACVGGGPTSEPTADSGAGARPSSTAALSIVVPRNGSVVHGSSVQVRISLRGARIVPTTSTDLRPDRGHVHLLLDGILVSMNYGLRNTITDVAPGHHLLQAEFVATDHLPFDPRVIAVASFEVRA